MHHEKKKLYLSRFGVYEEHCYSGSGSAGGPHTGQHFHFRCPPVMDCGKQT